MRMKEDQFIVGFSIHQKITDTSFLIPLRGIEKVKTEWGLLSFAHN